MASVSVAGIIKDFDVTRVLKGISLDVKDGEFLTLLGPSGCGKSTLLRVIAGLEPQSGGSVVIGGQVVDTVRPKRRDVAMVFQTYALYPHMTVAQNIALPLRMRRLSFWQRLPLVGRLLPRTRQIELAIAGEVAAVAAAAGIDALLDRKPVQLSGGQRQRVAVGRAMVRHPAVFLMDEPLSNLDAKLRVQMRAEIKELHRRLGVTFIYVTHDQAEAMTLSDRVAVMLDGELLQVSAPQDIYFDPIDLRVAEFVGSPKINILPASRRDRGNLDVAGSTLAISTSTSGPVKLGIRSEFFSVADQPGPGVLSGAIRLVEHLGSDLFVHVEMPGVGEPVIARVGPEHLGQLKPGHTLNLTVRADRVMMFGADGRRLRPENSSVTPLRSVK